MNCDQCRAEMSTDGLLSKLRCAECRQIRFDQFCDVALKTGMAISVGYLVIGLFRIVAPHRQGLASQVEGAERSGEVCSRGFQEQKNARLAA